MLRRVILGAGIASLLGISALTGVGGATAAPGQPSSCVLKGVAHINPGLAVASRAFSYTFTGSFTQCKGSDPTISTGSVTASGSGSGGCSKSATTGTARITWNNGQTSSLSFKTTGAAAALLVQGTITSGEFAGQAAKALLAFQATPTDCNTANGVTAPSFTGPAEVGR
jgi:hypothetical protein